MNNINVVASKESKENFQIKENITSEEATRIISKINSSNDSKFKAELKEDKLIVRQFLRD